LSNLFQSVNKNPYVYLILNRERNLQNPLKRFELVARTAKKEK
jgi:hypothetical protein